jgi:hypothetical protein
MQRTLENTSSPIESIDRLDFFQTLALTILFFRLQRECQITPMALQPGCRLIFWEIRAFPYRLALPVSTRRT